MQFEYYITISRLNICCMHFFSCKLSSYFTKFLKVIKKLLPNRKDCKLSSSSSPFLVFVSNKKLLAPSYYYMTNIDCVCASVHIILDSQHGVSAHPSGPFGFFTYDTLITNRSQKCAFLITAYYCFNTRKNEIPNVIIVLLMSLTHVMP